MYKYCHDIVKRYDADRYALSLVAPPKHRNALWSLFAFIHEIAKTREVVSDTRAGLIRLTWWRDAITAIYDGGNIPEHEVCQPLAKTIKNYDLPRDLFETLIYAREFDLEGVPPETMEGLIHYADITNTSLLLLCTHILDIQESESTIKNLAIAYGLIGITRALPYHASINKCLLPSNRLNDLCLKPEQFNHLKPSDSLNKIVKDVLISIHVCLNNAQPETRFLKAIHKMLRIYARTIQKYDYNVFDIRVGRQPPFLGLRILFS